MFSLKSLMHRISHRLVFGGSYTSGGARFFAYGEETEEPLDGQVIVYDTRFKQEYICGYIFTNRYLMDRSPQERCLAIWQECMSTDGLRPLAVVEQQRMFSPYGPPQPLPRRYKKLFEHEDQRVKLEHDQAALTA